MTNFYYRHVGEKLFEELRLKLASGTSCAMIAPRYRGKRYTVRRVVDLLEENRSGKAALLDLEATIQTVDALARRIAEAVGQPPGAGILGSVDRWWHATGNPLILLAPNLDVLPHELIQRFLRGVRERVEQKQLVVLLGGDHHYQNFIDGPNSEFNCAEQYVLQGFEKAEFGKLVSQYEAQLKFEISPEARETIWKQSGGQPLLLRQLLNQAVEFRAKGRDGHAGVMTSEQVNALADSFARPSALRRMFSQADEAIRDSPEVWKDLDRLIEHSIQAPLEPGPLELSGLAERSGEYLKFSSPLAEKFARLWYTPRRLADYCALAGRWDEAFARYEKLGRDHWARPADTSDRIDIQHVVRALGARLDKEEDSDRVVALFHRAAEVLLGFREISYWRHADRWEFSRNALSEFPSDKRDKFAQALPPAPANKSARLDLPGSWSGRALAATLRTPDRDRPEVLCLSDATADQAIPKDRLAIAAELFDAFLSAYDHARQIQFLKAKIEVRSRHEAILDSLLSPIGEEDLDRKSICEHVAGQLRELGYRRVLLCLTDFKRERIKGVVDNSDQPHIDVAAKTDYALDGYDLQPFVIRRGTPFVTSDVSTEPLANPAVVQATGHKALAIVPMLDRDSGAIGTIHVERNDGEKPSESEVGDLLDFGRRLALVLAHCERSTIVNRSLDLVADPIAVVDPSFRWRYANASAAKLLDIPQGWSNWTYARRVPESHKLFPALQRVLASRQKDQLVDDHLCELKLEQDRYHLNCAPLRDAAGNVNGGRLLFEDFTRVQRLVEVMGAVIRSGTAEAAIAAVLKGMETLGQKKSRIYRIQPRDGQELLVSYRAIGMDDSYLAKFNAGGFFLAPCSPNHHSWACIERKKGLVFVWRPDGIDNSDEFTDSGIQARVVCSPEYQNELGKQPGDFWIDLPLFTAAGEPLGKLATHIPPDLDPQQFWILQLLASLVSAVLEAFIGHDQQQRWFDEGYQKSLATISHHLMNRVAALDPLHWRFANVARGNPKEFDNVLRDFGAVLGTITATIRRARDFLKPPKPEPTRFDVRDLCIRLVSSHVDGKIESQVSGSREPIQIEADKDLIAGAICEVVTNANKALIDSAQPQLDVVVTPDSEGSVIIRFCDNGCGVAAENRERIFEDLESCWPGQQKSTGLGLPWARRVMRAHGGDLTLDSTHTPGACFEMRIPIQYKGAQKDAKVQDFTGRR